jgi:hypothetical protein
MKEIMILENKGNKVYVGVRVFKSGRNATLRISLPKEAINVQLMSPSLIKSGAGLMDTSEIRPGTKKILFSYQINPQELNRKRRVLKQRAVEITKILQSRDE